MTLRLSDELKEMLAIMKDDVGAMVTAGYFLGTRIGKEPQDASGTLLSVASGDLTLQPSGAELRLKYPGRADVEEIRNENQKVDRIIAHLVCEYLFRQKPG
jgi:hypothetical protein